MKSYSVRIQVQSDSDPADHDGVTIAVYAPSEVRAAQIAATIEGFAMNELIDLMKEAIEE